MKRLTKAALLAACIAATAASGAGAAGLTLRIGDTFPIGHFTPESLVKVWMEKVKSLAPGAVDFEYYQAGQMGKAKDMLSLAQTGVLDIAYVGPSYVSDKMPLSAVAELPEAFADACHGTMAYWQLAKPGGALDKAEFAPNGIRVLLVTVLPPYQVYTASRDITGIDSFKGLKVRTTGGAKEIATVKLGAVPVQMAAPETRDALSRGTIDALLFPTPSILPYDLASVLKYATDGMNFGSFVITYAISRDRWDALPAEVQKAMEAASDEAIRSGCEAVDRLNTGDKKKIEAAGVTYRQLPDADKAKIEAMMGTVGEEWAKQLDARGKPGGAILAAFRKALSDTAPAK